MGADHRSGLALDFGQLLGFKTALAVRLVQRSLGWVVRCLLLPPLRQVGERAWGNLH
jgi:hypothetical protein